MLSRSRQAFVAMEARYNPSLNSELCKAGFTPRSQWSRTIHTRCAPSSPQVWVCASCRR